MRAVRRLQLAEVSGLRCLPATGTLAMAKEHAVQLLPLAIELFCQLVGIPKDEADCDSEQLPATERTSKRLARAFTPQFGGTDLIALPTGDLGMITVLVGVQKLGDRLARGAFKRQRAGRW